MFLSVEFPRSVMSLTTKANKSMNRKSAPGVKRSKCWDFWVQSTRVENNKEVRIVFSCIIKCTG
jgi:hypothetical protein